MNDVTRLCSNCRQKVTRADENRGYCPKCKGILLTLGDPYTAYWNELTKGAFDLAYTPVIPRPGGGNG